MAAEPKVELALRRTIFFFVLIVLYLLFGAACLSLFGPPRQDKSSLDKMERLDVKRAELLNVLWAETLVKTENDWEELANQKLEIYEKALFTNAAAMGEQNDRTFWGHFDRAFSLITTIGPIDCRELSTSAKVFAFFYAGIGVPLALLYLGQCNRVLSSLFPQARIFVPSTILIFIGAVIYDIVEHGTDDTPFLDAMFSVFLQYSTIGEEDPKVRNMFTYVLCLVGLSLMSVSLITIQHLVESHLSWLELTYSRMFGNVERWANEKGTRHANRIEEEDEEEEEESGW